MDELTADIKKNIILELKLSNELDEIQPDTPLFDNPVFAIDSIDAVIIVVMIQKKYGIKIEDLAAARKILFSINSMAEFIEKNRPILPGQKI